MNARDFWYVVAESHELGRKAPIARIVMGEWLVVFRDAEGQPAILQNRCKHRAARLSRGTLKDGQLQCAYHGWRYDRAGSVTGVPSEGENFRVTQGRCAKAYAAVEVDGFVYVRLQDSEHAAEAPFRIRHYGEKGWHTTRLQNRFKNNVTNCVENFIDIPHTVFVHPGIFRKSRKQQVDVKVERKGGWVCATYANETDNLGWFAKFLNPSGAEIKHTDEFFMPNVSCVEYGFGPKRSFIITSQSVPVSETETMVYTDLTWNYGIWTRLATPIVRWQGQAIIDQDLEVLADQMEVIEKYGADFSSTASDSIHLYVESIQRVLEKDGNPMELPDKSTSLSMFI